MISLGISIAALKAARSLERTTGEVSRSFERLSSGLRINRASDDAAGLAVASSLQAQARLHSQAMRNINDGLSALNIMSGALQSQSDLLQRLNELATQAANGTLSSSQRVALNREYQQLLLESGRIAETTTFNDLRLLQAGRSVAPSSLNIQVGISGGGSSVINFQTTNTSRFSGNINVGGDIGAQGGVAGSDGYIDNNDQIIFLSDYLSGNVSQESLDRLGEAATITVTGTDGITREFAVVIHSISLSSTNGRIDVFEKQSDGTYIRRSGTDVDFDTSTGLIVGATTKTLALGGTRGNAVLDLAGLRVFMQQAYNGNPSLTSAPNSAIDFTSVDSVLHARSALGYLSNRMNELNQTLGMIGATQSRFETAFNLTQSLFENELAAKSRITDIDIAQESANLLRLQILQQAATAILANAGQQPQLVLMLLS